MSSTRPTKTAATSAGASSPHRRPVIPSTGSSRAARTWGEALKDADRNYFNYAMKIGLILHDMPVESTGSTLTRRSRTPGACRSRGSPTAPPERHRHGQVAGGQECGDPRGGRRAQDGSGLPRQDDRKHLPPARHGPHGSDPSKSVLNEWGQAHDVDNLFVVDGSGFPTATGVNPTLTMMANAWRCWTTSLTPTPRAGPNDSPSRPDRKDLLK